MRSSSRNSTSHHHEQQVVGEHLAVDQRPSTSDSKGSNDGLKHAGFLKLRPSSPPVMSLSCEARVWNAAGHRQRDHRVEDRLHAQREQADHQRQHSDSRSAAPRPHEHRREALAQARAGDRHAVGADAEEHGVREADDAGVAQQQVVAGHQQDEDQHLGRHAQRLAAREQEGRQGQRDDHQISVSASQRLRG
jgi:hypothetical protein